MRFRIYDHRTRSPIASENLSFDEAVTVARNLALSDPSRFLEVQRLEEPDEWIPTGWTFGVQGDWE